MRKEKEGFAVPNDISSVLETSKHSPRRRRWLAAIKLVSVAGDVGPGACLVFRIRPREAMGRKIHLLDQRALSRK